MSQNHARFIKSAVQPHEYPADRGIEIAIAGRSNAGKSSLINTMVGARIAKVSGTPGKTRLLNFFEVNKAYTLVDMPGYGFAARSGGEMHDWQTMIETYFATRKALRGLILVMDSRREWTEDEELMKEFVERRGIPMAIAFTKVDKLTRNELGKALGKVKKDAALDAVFPISSLKKTGQVEFEEWMYRSWVKPEESAP